jgi:hypothetical protein
MRDAGDGSPDTTHALRRLFGRVKQIEPRGSTQDAFFQKTVDATDGIVTARQDRVTASGGSLPVPAACSPARRRAARRSGPWCP